MNLTLARCPKCQHEISKTDSALANCPHCGEVWPADPSTPFARSDIETQTSSERRRWRLCFWLIFLLTPAATMLLAAQPRWLFSWMPPVMQKLLHSAVPTSARWFLFLLAGAWGAGFCLAKLHTKARTPAALLLTSLGLGAALMAVYVAIAFAGCLLLMSAFKNV